MFTRYRTLTGRVLGILAVIYVLLAAPPPGFPAWLMELSEWLGYVLLVTAAFGRLWCLTFIAGKKDKELLAVGPYSVTRNPLYVFSFLGAIGFGLAVKNPPLAALLAIFFIVTYPLTVAHEEKFLADAFGEVYASYRARTPRWIPDWRQYHEPATIVIKPSVIRRGILDAMWFLWLFLIWEVVDFFRETGLVPTWL